MCVYDKQNVCLNTHVVLHMQNCMKMTWQGLYVNTFNAAHFLVFFPSHQSGLCFFQVHRFKSCISGLLHQSTKVFLICQEKVSLERGLHPIPVLGPGQKHTHRRSWSFWFSLPFPHRVKPLGFWTVCAVYFPTPRPSLSSLEFQVKWSERQSGHKPALFNASSLTLPGT